jgi:hypothetical protein
MSALAAKLPIETPSQAPRIAATFNLDDPAERYMIETMQRVHDGGYFRAHAIKRSKTKNGERLIVELATIHAARRTSGWTLILWNIDEVSIRFKTCHGQRAAQAAFTAQAE